MFQAKAILNQLTCYLHGAGGCWSPGAAVPGWEGAMPWWGETPQTSSPFVLPSVLRAIPGEGGGMAGGVADRFTTHAHAHLLPAQTSVPLSTPSFPS